MNVIVIGGGPAGLLAAISSAKQNNRVTVLEKMDSCGKKLLITGKGRCNITNGCDITEFFENVPTNPKFLFSAFNNFTNKDIIEMLENEGVNVKEERGKRIFPVSDKSQDVLNAILKIAKRLNIDIKFNSKVTKIETIEEENGKVVTGVICNNNFIKADKVIIATGGKSYPVTGSTGDGYSFAKELGHTITLLRPSLVPLTSDDNTCMDLQGLSLKNVEIKVKEIYENDNKEANGNSNNKNEKLIYKDFGEMLFTHFGVSGPIVLSASAHLVRVKNIEELFKSGNIKLEIDLKPALDFEKLDQRVLRDFAEEKNKDFKNSLDKLLPQKLIPVVVRLSGIDENKKVNEITKKERENLVNILKCLKINITGFRNIEEAIITNGGINVKEINPKTMESKLVKGLFFAGEIIDVDALTGGFNLQIAWSTGFTSGM